MRWVNGSKMRVRLTPSSLCDFTSFRADSSQHYSLANLQVRRLHHCKVAVLSTRLIRARKYCPFQSSGLEGKSRNTSFCTTPVLVRLIVQDSQYLGCFIQECAPGTRYDAKYGNSWVATCRYDPPVSWLVMTVSSVKLTIKGNNEAGTEMTDNVQ